MALSPNTPFKLEKTIWTEADFDRMSWHDVHVHALAFNIEQDELLLDIDYLFAWVNPEPPESHFTFWMAPCTLVFANVHSFSASIEHGLGFEIGTLSREDAGRPGHADHSGKEKEWRWRFDCQEGSFAFHATGFQQFTRRQPVRTLSQVFPWDKRGGVSFACSLHPMP